MIYGLGVDITEIPRIQKIQQKNQSFAKKVLTKAELNYYQKLTTKRQAEFLAGRFSIKEAYSKALGTGIGKAVAFMDLEVLNDKSGKPKFTNHPYDDRFNVHGSISHTDHLVMTEVILEEK